MVTETITVVAAGQEVKRGITRTLPLPVELLTVRRDGRAEPYHTTRRDGHLTLYAGERAVLLEPGTYSYQLTYRVPDAVKSLDSLDVLSFDLLGPDVAFPVDRLSATVHVPTEARLTGQACYTGVSGDTARDCTITSSSEGVLQVTGQGTYGQGRAMLVWLDFAPGTFTAAPAAVSALQGQTPSAPPARWPRYLTLLLLLTGSAAGGYYAYTSWRRYGVDPPRPDLPPQFTPPRGHSPAAVSYLGLHMDATAQFSASLLALTTQGYLELEDELDTSGSPDGYLVRRPADSPSPDRLPQEQRVVLDQLFRRQPTYSFRSAFDSYLVRVIAAHTESLQQQFSAYLRKGNNGRRIWPLLGILLFTLAAGLLASRPDPTGWSLKMVFLFGLAAVVGLIIYAVVIAQPSMDLVRLWAEIKAFKTYLGLSEKKRAALPNAPEMNKVHYEELLPYAIALGIHTDWTDYFSALTTQPSNQAVHGTGWRGVPHRQFVQHFTTTVSAGTYDTSSSSSSSSSNSSGGGGSRSVGGGSSGGGGAGGW